MLFGDSIFCHKSVNFLEFDTDYTPPQKAIKYPKTTPFGETTVNTLYYRTACDVAIIFHNFFDDD